MSLDAVSLSRIQFAFTIGYHILWPAWTIGISGFIVILNLLWLRTRRTVYRDLLRFWIHLFALGFAMGVVTGIVLSYEIGTNWSLFAERTSNVIGPYFTYEVLTAFFLEAGSADSDANRSPFRFQIARDSEMKSLPIPR